MITNTDVAFHMGATHTICQDYGRTHPNMVAISDGCSSSPDSDFGARTIVECAASFNVAGEFYLNYVAEAARDAVNAWYRNTSAGQAKHEEFYRCLDATLLVASTYNDGAEVGVHAGGDGVIVVEFSDGSRVIYKIEYSGNAPFYPSYTMQQTRFDQYIKSFGGVASISVWSDEADDWCHNSTISAPAYFNLKYPTRLVRRITLMTDGASSFSSRDGSPVRDIYVIEELIRYPNVAGAFVQRRLAKALKTFAHRGWVQNDDLTVGCLNFEAQS